MGTYVFDDAVLSSLERERVSRNKTLAIGKVGGENVCGGLLDGNEQGRSERNGGG